MDFQRECGILSLQLPFTFGRLAARLVQVYAARLTKQTVPREGLPVASQSSLTQIQSGPNYPP